MTCTSRTSHEKINYSINPSFVSTKFLSSDVRVVFVFILKHLSSRATATRLCPSCHAKLIFPQCPFKSTTTLKLMYSLSVFLYALFCWHFCSVLLASVRLTLIFFNHMKYMYIINIKWFFFTKNPILFCKKLQLPFYSHPYLNSLQQPPLYSGYISTLTTFLDP